MNIYIFGNTIVPEDAGAVKMLPKLQKQFPDISFIHSDPTGNWWKGDTALTIIDTVQGIHKVTVFTSLELIEETQSLTVHDYDLYMDLKLMMKLGKIKSFQIIGVPTNVISTNLTQIIKSIKKNNGSGAR